MDACIEGRGLWGGRLIVFRSLASTNTWVLEHASDCRHGDIVQAEHQTAGHGRFERGWLSPPSRGLAVTFVLKHVSPALLPNLGQLAALAVHRILARHGVAGALKWPNDVMVGDRKVAGILAEKAADGATVALGVGLNVNVTAEGLGRIPLLQPATSLLAETGHETDLAALRDGLAAELAGAIDAVGSGLGPLLRAWEATDWLSGKRVSVAAEGPRVVVGRYDGLHEDGRLRLRDDGGRMHLFWSGEVQRVRRQQ